MSKGTDGEALVWTVKRTAKELELGINQTYAAIKSGAIPSLRFGKRIVVPVAALHKKLEGAA